MFCRRSSRFCCTYSSASVLADVAASAGSAETNDDVDETAGAHRLHRDARREVADLSIGDGARPGRSDPREHAPREIAAGQDPVLRLEVRLGVLHVGRCCCVVLTPSMASDRSSSRSISSRTLARYSGVCE